MLQEVLRDFICPFDLAALIRWAELCAALTEAGIARKVQLYSIEYFQRGVWHYALLLGRDGREIVIEVHPLESESLGTMYTIMNRSQIMKFDGPSCTLSEVVEAVKKFFACAPVIASQGRLAV